MKPRFTLLALFLATSSVALVGADSAPKYPPHALSGTELRVLPPHANGRTYQLHVSLPASYATETERRYPVLFVTDGYWDFPTMWTSYNNLIYDRVVPEFIIVGLGYAGENLDYGRLRGWELSPVPLEWSPDDSGHATEFLAYLEQEIIPFMEREYRADPKHRALAGSSLGGAFTLFAMYTKPELFEGYIAASPAVNLQNGWLFDYEKAFAESGKPLRARLYMTGAENEWPTFLAGIERFDRQIAQRNYEGFAYQYRQIDGERHAGTKAESYVRGMRFVFEPLAPETGRMADRQ